MLSWSVAVASRSAENRGKHPRFCQRNTKPLFANTPAHISGKNLFIFKMAVWGGSHAHEMTLLFRMTVFTPIIVQKQQKPTDGLQRKNAAVAASRSPRLGFWLFEATAAALSYFQSLSRSSIAMSRAVFMLFSMMLKISFSRMDYCFFLSFFFFSLSL